MALFNYSEQYSKIQQYISTSTNTVGESDLLKLFFSADSAGAGHLITHGIDFTPTYSGGKRGLVPGNSGTLATTYLRGDGWKALWSQADEDAAKATGSTDAEKATNLNNYLAQTLVSAGDVKTWISNSFSTQDAMRFKGTLAVSGTTVTGVNGGTGGFPTTCEIGDTYKISGSGTVAGQTVGTGDLLICYKDGASTTLNSADYWTIVQDNVEALVTHTVNGTAYHLYSSDTNLASGITIYAPTSSGTSTGLVLTSVKGGTPVWTAQSSITAGEVTNSLSAGTGITLKTSGGTAQSYNGSAAISVNLNAATTSTLGGVKIMAQAQSTLWGDTSSNKDTTQATLSINNGALYITRQNVINALGYTPGASSSTITGIVLGDANTDSANETVKSSPYLNILAGTTVVGSVQIKSGTGITASAASGVLTISQNSANTSTIGGIKVGKVDSSYAVTTQTSGTFSADITSGKYYAVELDKNNKAFVYVPWISSVFSSTADGLVPKSTGNTSSSKASTTTYLLGSDAKWYQLPTTAFEGTWRNIKVKGTEILSSAPKNSSGNANPALNLTAGGHTSITAIQSNNAYTGEVKISSTWRDIKTASTSDPYTTSSIGDNTLEFANSATGGIWTVGGSKLTSYLVWYNIDSGEYELV